MSTVDLARFQFAWTSVNHFFFVPVTIGLAFLTALLQTWWYRNKNPDLLRLTRFFGTLLLISVAVGVVTGLVQEFEFGMNWGAYSRLVGNVFGPPLAMEGLAAFFLESTFLGLWVFGWDKLSRRVHLLCIWLVAAGSMLSAAFILAANSWMQHPVGYKMVGGKPQLDNIVAVFTNPVFLWGYGKVVLASVTTGTLVMLAVSAWQLRKGKDPEIFGHSLRLSLIVLVPAITLTLFVGDMLGVVEGTYQPMKIAAAEAQWTTCQPCSFSLFQIGGGNNDHTPVQIIQVPHLLSLLATNTWNGKVVGMTPLQNQYSAKYGPGDYVPNVFIQYWGMRVMAYLGGLVWVFALWGAVAAVAQETRRPPGCSCCRHLGRHHPVPDEHRGLAPHRKRPPAVDRAGDHAHQERDLPVDQLHLPGHQRDHLHRALRRPGGAVPGVHAAVLPPRTRPGPAAGGAAGEPDARVPSMLY